MANGTSEKRVYTLGQLVLALAVLLGVAGGLFAVTDRFATAAALGEVTKRLDRIEQRLDVVYDRLPAGRRDAP